MATTLHRLFAFALTMSLALLCMSPKPASADPALRKQMNLNGDFVLFGNTLSHDCARGANAVPRPIVGTVGTGMNCPDNNTYAPDVYWRSDAPADGQASANVSITPQAARSTAVLVLPASAEVVYARLYWGALSAGAGPDQSVRMQRTSSGLDTVITADDSVRINVPATLPRSNRFWYQSTSDVTALVKAQGPGAYRLADVEAVDLSTGNDSNPVAGWFMIVLYSRAGDPSRNLAIFDGLDLVTQTIGSAAANLTGFLVPNAGFDAKLGVVAYEGEERFTGDALAFNGTTLSNAVNPANNFFNASRSQLGAALSVQGDLPQLTGAPGSLSNLDLDVMNVKSLVRAGDTSAMIEASTTLDTFLLAAFVTSISTFKPDFVTSGKTVSDINGGAVRPGDQLEYRIEANNTGSDVSVKTVVQDTLPAGVSFVPGSIEIVSGANAGAKTDAAADDQAEYDAAMRKISVRIGTGATASMGGNLAIGESSVIRFRVTVDASASGTISNQAIIVAQGEQGAPSENTVTDGNGVGPGQPATDVTIDTCEADQDCSGATPFCDVASVPRACVACVTSAQCTDPALPDCNFATHVCECAAGDGCKDSDGDGISDSAEKTLGTDPMDADTDDDGVPDGSELAPDKDSDGDGLINALDPDSDNDGLFDGTELGLACDNPATRAESGNCRPDADMGKTKTNPINRDTDDGGATDGSEDFNLNGAIDAGETDPTAGHGSDDSKVKDSDGDGLGDEMEKVLHSDPNDADTDNDGLLDGDEANPSTDSDGDKLNSVLDVDSDNDALYDGTELGKDCSNKATDATLGHCIADSDGGATQTSPILRDTDGGGASDGSEDANRNGVVDGTETDPTRGMGADDKGVKDSDMDGLSDALEMNIGTDPNDADSDDDGALDGEEANPADDNDGDKTIDALDTDSDNDGLFDGTEQGKGCDNKATDHAKASCRADTDHGATTTSPIHADTDFGGKNDGAEDANQNGRIDTGESDPNDARDDKVGDSCMLDTDCGATDSGVVCDGTMCVLGCRGTAGNSCPAGEKCSSTTKNLGSCDKTSMTPDGGVPTGDGGVPTTDGGGTGGSHSKPSKGTGGTGSGIGSLGGGGCDCRTVGTAQNDLYAALPILGTLLLIRRRRRGGSITR